MTSREESPMDLEGTFVDLSQEIYTGMPVYPGHLKTVIFTHASHEEVKRAIGTGFSYQTSGILMCDHGPTHIDRRSTRFLWSIASRPPSAWM
jgi:kynurenine formamidase